VGVFGEIILQGRVLGIRLIVTGREGNHVVERSCFHKSEFTHNGLSPLCSHEIARMPNTASILTPVNLPCSVNLREPMVRFQI